MRDRVAVADDLTRESAPRHVAARVLDRGTREVRHRDLDLLEIPVRIFRLIAEIRQNKGKQI